MPNSNMKNIVVLKNLPSNLIDEAIVILKSNKSAKKLEHIERTTIYGYKEPNKTNDYVIKEAECVIANYVSKIEKSQNSKKTNNNIEIKYKKIKLYSIIVSSILIFSIIKNLLV